MADSEEDYSIRDSDAQTIADRESWLRSLGMMPYTDQHEFWTKMDKENIESRKIHSLSFFLINQNDDYVSVLMEETVDNLLPCETVPGKITDGFKQHLDTLKQ